MLLFLVLKMYFLFQNYWKYEILENKKMNW